MALYLVSLSNQNNIKTEEIILGFMLFYKSVFKQIFISLIKLKFFI